MTEALFPEYPAFHLFRGDRNMYIRTWKFTLRDGRRVMHVSTNQPQYGTGLSRLGTVAGTPLEFAQIVSEETGLYIA